MGETRNVYTRSVDGDLAFFNERVAKTVDGLHRSGQAFGVVGVGFLQHRFGRFGLSEGLGDGKLYALVLTDGATENHALARIVRGLLDEPARVTDALGGVHTTTAEVTA